MSKPRYGWWSYAKYMVRIYPKHKKEYNALHKQSMSVDPSRVSGKGYSRTTENVALCRLPPAQQAEYDAVTKAIETTKLLKDGESRLALIDMVFWKKSHSLDGAAYAVNFSYTWAARAHQSFLRLVGYYRGLCDSFDAA